MWIAFRFCIFVLWTQWSDIKANNHRVVNCFQILYIRSLNTISNLSAKKSNSLWIAFRFCIFVLWTQFNLNKTVTTTRCELLSDFVYSFFEHNGFGIVSPATGVVNCFQILYIRSLNTIPVTWWSAPARLWIAFRFCIFVLWTQLNMTKINPCSVVNCFQILYIRSLNTIRQLWHQRED